MNGRLYSFKSLWVTTSTNRIQNRGRACVEVCVVESDEACILFPDLLTFLYLLLPFLSSLRSLTSGVFLVLEVSFKIVKLLHGVRSVSPPIVRDLDWVFS